MRWLAKKILDEDGKVINYKLGPKTNSNQKPSAEYDLLEGQNIPRQHAKIQKDANGEWEVVEDASKKDAVELKRTEKIATKARLKNVDWQNMTAGKQRNLLKDLINYLVE